MKNETHRPDPSFDERANEDGYFAVKERELIENMKNEFRQSQEGRRKAQMAACPKCSGTFAPHRFLEIDLERCQQCEGIWLNKGDLEALLKQQARGPLGVFLDRCFAKNETRKAG